MRLTGTVSIVSGQQSYALTFSPAFSVAPIIVPTVEMASSSGEIFYASVDRSSITVSGATVWLSGIPIDGGGVIAWEATTPSIGSITIGAEQGGMTVVQLFHRIGRRSRTGDFTKLSLTEQTDILEAVNAALQQVYNALPTYFKELTEGFALPAPLAITGVGVTQFSKTVTANTFTRAQLGRTVRLDGDDQWNQVNGTGELLNPYMGATGTVAGTVYGDAIFSDIYPMDRFIGFPRYPNQSFGWPINFMGFISGNMGFPNWPYMWSIGTPRGAWVQTFGNSQGHSPMAVLKFSPLPDTDYPVNVRIAFWPKRLSLADYQAASTLVVPSQFLEPALIPLALRAYMRSPSWNREINDSDLIIQDAKEAEIYLRQQPGQIGAPNNRVYCPIGF